MGDTLTKIAVAGLVSLVIAGGAAFSVLDSWAERDRQVKDAVYEACLARFDYNRDGRLSNRELADLQLYLTNGLSYPY
jgi:hypothetical protein